MPSQPPSIVSRPVTQTKTRQPTRRPHLIHRLASDPSLKNIQVIIPARNEAEAIAPVIQALQRTGLTRILVIDNGSSDNTTAIARHAGADVIHEARPGYGQACWQGLLNLDPATEWVLFCDADGSDDLSQLPRFFQLRHHHDFILGNRRATPSGRRALTPVQNFGNWLSTRLIALGWGHPYNDLGPLRLIRRDALEQIRMRDRGFG